MKLSSAYILEQLKKEYRVQDQNKISGEDGFFRPLFCLDHEKESAGHIKICSAETAASGEGLEQDVLWILCGSGKSSISAPYIQITGSDTKNAISLEASVLNSTQRMFDRCDEW